MPRKIIVAIDGYSSCGKSTIAKGLAKKLNYTYLDTGAMYRAVTLFFTRNNIDLKNHQAVKNALKNISISFNYNNESGIAETFLNGENVEKEIRNINSFVSEVSTNSKIRKTMVEIQKKIGQQKEIVIDGRDIGTVVFPEAELKIFMTAYKNIRAKRRWDELTAKGISTTFEEVKKNLEQRDHIDTTRMESPLRKAEDAVVLDNSTLTLDEQLEFVFQLAQQKINS